MTIFETIVLGLVQGITEFIPVSSSGHLAIFNSIFDHQDAFVFDVLLNFGTLLALYIYYRHRIYGIVQDIVIHKKIRLAWQLALATLPVVLVGYVMSGWFEQLTDATSLVVAMLFIVGLVMIYFGKQRTHANNGPLENLATKTFLGVGLAQVLALVPGTSRSGISILAGLRQGLTYERAAELSFLLAIPTIFGASLKTLLSSEGRSFLVDNLDLVLLGNAVSFLSGYLAIAFMLKLLGKYGLVAFGWYRIGLATVLAVLLSVNIL